MTGQNETESIFAFYFKFNSVSTGCYMNSNNKTLLSLAAIKRKKEEDTLAITAEVKLITRYYQHKLFCEYKY